MKQGRMKWIMVVFALSAIMTLGACKKKVAPPPPPPPPPPPVRCHVPRVIGLTLRGARRRIRRANCSVGRVRRARSRRIGRVIGQSPRAGAVRSSGFPVNLVVGRR